MCLYEFEIYLLQIIAIFGVAALEAMKNGQRRFEQFRADSPRIRPPPGFLIFQP